jgi:hypothetical protein
MLPLIITTLLVLISLCFYHFPTLKELYINFRVRRQRRQRRQARRRVGSLYLGEPFEGRYMDIPIRGTNDQPFPSELQYPPGDHNGVWITIKPHHIIDEDDQPFWSFLRTPFNVRTRLLYHPSPSHPNQIHLAFNDNHIGHLPGECGEQRLIIDITRERVTDGTVLPQEPNDAPFHDAMRINT